MVNRRKTRRAMSLNPKTRIVTRVVLQVHKLKILQHLKNPPPLTDELASIGTHVLEKNEQLSRPSRNIKEILRAHFMNYDDFCLILTQVACLLTQQIEMK